MYLVTFMLVWSCFAGLIEIVDCVFEEVAKQVSKQDMEGFGIQLIRKS